MAQLDLITHFPFGLSSRGMPVIGGGGRETTGNVYFVSSTASGKSDNINTHGTNPVTPFATLDFAIGACTANRGDIIYLMPGHAETIIAAGGIDADVAGITIIGLGNGSNRPTLTLGTSTTADIDIDAANITIENVVFDCTGVDAVIAALDVNAAAFQLLNCEFITATSGNQAARIILTDSNANRMKIWNCLFRGSNNAGNVVGVDIGGTPDGVEIAWCRFQMNVSADCVDISAASTNNYIHDNQFITLGTAQSGLQANAAATGFISYNQFAGTSLSVLLVPSLMFCIENYGIDTDLGVNQIQTLLPRVGTSLPESRSIIDEIIGAEMSYNRANYLTVTADLTSATWNTVAAHEILTVTGAVRVRILPICTGSVTSGGAITGILGTETTTNGMITSTDLTTLDAGMAWLSDTPNHLYAKTSVLDFIIADGQDVGYTIGSNAATGGTIVFHVWWEPLNSTGAVTAGAGGAL